MRGTTSLIAIALSIYLGAPPRQPRSTFLIAPQHDAWRSAASTPGSSLSADGRSIAFESYARLAPADANSNCDVYVVERVTGRVTLESVSTDGAILRGGGSTPRMSGDGRYLVFETMVQTADSRGIRTEIVLRDRTQLTTQWVSRNPSGAVPSGSSRHPAISSDGRFVGFASSVADLVAGRDENEDKEDVYLYEVATGRTRRISTDSQSVQRSDGASHSPSISGDGRYVAFTSTARFDGEPAPFTAGRPVGSIYVRDTELGKTERVNPYAAATAPDGHSSDPSISRDGRYVVFASEATNLVPGDRNRSSDIFLRDLRTHAPVLVSRGTGGGPANGASRAPVVSGDGRFVAFQSEASDLICARRCPAADEDINLVPDVFRFDRLTGLMIRISGGSEGGWPEESSSPQFDSTGEVIAFASRHPIDERDSRHDFDLFVRIETPTASITRRH
jgi:Tol biopolymer transport system component